jgi:hypothetical protein
LGLRDQQQSVWVDKHPLTRIPDNHIEFLLGNLTDCPQCGMNSFKNEFIPHLTISMKKEPEVAA